METSKELKNIAAALSKAQAEFPIFKKEKTVNVTTKSGATYSYNYTDLGAMFQGVIPILSANNLCFSQSVDHADDDIIIVSLLLHSSGEFLKSTLRLPVVDDTKNIVQSIGSSITYGRRYAAGALLGVASEADDDATGAGNGGPAAKSNGGKKKFPDCPKCNQQKYVIISKQDPTKYYCLKGKGGCGATWDIEPKTTENKGNKIESPQTVRDLQLKSIFNVFTTTPAAANIPENSRADALYAYVSKVLGKQIIDSAVLTAEQIQYVIKEMARNPKEIEKSISMFIDNLNK